MSTSQTPLSRRTFLKRITVGATAIATAQVWGDPAQFVQADEAAADQGWGMLVDLTRCVGCNSCALACKTANQLPHVEIEPQTLSSQVYTFVDERPVTTTGGQTETRHVKRQCMHCLDAACVAACPAGAMVKSETGPVIYRAERCLGCRYCQLACPFEAPSFEWADGLTPVISKCWLCYNRLQQGKKPACVEACPTGALRFGKRDRLLAQAHGQIASNPHRYIDHVFGEFEVGGTSILYLSDIPFEAMGFPVDLPQTAPSLETEKIMSKLPLVIAGMAALLAGAAVYTQRKSALTLAARAEVPAPLPPGGDEQEK
ncbi:MAG: 4Fe-4S dicluster domain-containing protein [Chloroflexota bacterium]